MLRIRFLAGQESEEALMKASKQAADPKAIPGQESEAAFFAASRRLSEGDKPGATALFRKCQDIRPKGGAEGRLAEVELKALK
ncbi:MAG: hypothetical protein EOP86_09790 [Verrucomicrobiaceae bacterium]|nr:MAG: hypothetical protein EOP86_09790 [Verrucomicrobiaceae bacterium]